MKKLLWPVLAVCLVACRSGELAYAPLRLAFLPNLTHAQALVGVHEGTFQRALGNTHLEVRSFNAGSAAIEALLAGSVDVSYLGGGPAAVAYTRAKGSIHVIAGAASGGAVFVVMQGIHSPRDLLGKRVASPQLGNTQDVSLRTWLRQQGLSIASSPRSDGVAVTPISNADILSLFKKGQLAGAWVPEPWGARLVEEAGGIVLVDERDLWPTGRFPTTVLVASQTAMSQRRKELLQLVRVHAELTTEAREHHAQFALRANAALSELTHHPLGARVLEEAMSRLEFTVDPMEKELQLVAQHAFLLRFLPSADVRGLVDSSLLPAQQPGRQAAPGHF